MKKIYVIGYIITLCIHTSISHGYYQATTEDIQQTQNIIRTIHNLSTNKHDARHRYRQIFFLSQNYQPDTRIGYILYSIHDHLHTKLVERKKSAQIRENAQQSVQDFIEKYADYSITRRTPPEHCIQHYELLDMIGYIYDIPTSLILATWAKESTCRPSLPGNGRGPYQITSQNYGTGELTPSILLQTTEDFARFTRNKWDRFHKSNQKSGLTIDLGYTYITLTGLIRHVALYNGLSGNTVYGEIMPKNPGYLYDNRGDFSGTNRQGLLPHIIEFLLHKGT